MPWGWTIWRQDAVVTGELPAISAFVLQPRGGASWLLFPPSVVTSRSPAPVVHRASTGEHLRGRAVTLVREVGKEKWFESIVPGGSWWTRKDLHVSGRLQRLRPKWFTPFETSSPKNQPHGWFDMAMFYLLIDPQASLSNILNYRLMKTTSEIIK